jgi:hypothetical protein
MIRPGKVQVVRPTQFDQETRQTEGMIRMGAIVDMSNQLCASGTFVIRADTIKCLYRSPICVIALFLNVLY